MSSSGPLAASTSAAAKLMLMLMLMPLALPAIDGKARRQPGSGTIPTSWPFVLEASLSEEALATPSARGCDGGVAGFSMLINPVSA